MNPETKLHNSLMEDTYNEHEPRLDPDAFGSLVLDKFYNDKKASSFQRASLIAFMLHTRDIISGRGKYGEFYLLVLTFDKIIDTKEPFVSRQKTETMRVILHNVIACCVCFNGYGSWKDMKYLLNLLRDNYGEDAVVKKPLFKYIIYILSYQLKLDMANIHPLAGYTVSLAGKWAPREKSKMFGWQAKYIAVFCHHEWCGCNINLEDIKPLALKKCLTHYRKTIASLNRKLQTPQINQCARQWASIDFKKSVSRTTLEKQGLAFEYILPGGGIRRHYGNNWNHNYNDRMKCRINYISSKRSRRKNSGAFFYDSQELLVKTENFIYHPRYEWVWRDQFICHTY